MSDRSITIRPGTSIQRTQSLMDTTSFSGEILIPRPAQASPNPLCTEMILNGLIDFFRQEYRIGSHPNPIDGRKALKELAEHQTNFTPLKMTSIPVLLMEDGEFNNHFAKSTLRLEIKNCTDLCRDALQCIQPEMNHISDKSRTLWQIQGPAMRILERCALPVYDQTAAESDVKEIFEAYNNVLSRYRCIVDKWDAFQDHVDLFRSALERQLSSYSFQSKILQERILKRTHDLKTSYKKQKDAQKVELALQQSINDVGKGATSKTEDRTPTSLVDIESLEFEYQGKEARLQELKKEIEIRRKKFEENQVLEEDRRARRKKGKKQGSWFDYIRGSGVYDESIETTHAAKWMKIEKDMEERENAYIEEKVKLENEQFQLTSEIGAARTNNDRLSRLQHQQEQERARLGQKLDDLYMKTRPTGEIVTSQKSELEEDNVDAKYLESFGKILADLCPRLDEIARYSELCRTRYRTIHDKYRDDGTKLEDFHRRVCAGKPSRPEFERIRDDVVRMRITYFVVTASAVWSSEMSELNNEALRSSVAGPRRPQVYTNRHGSRQQLGPVSVNYRDEVLRNVESRERSYNQMPDPTSLLPRAQEIIHTSYEPVWHEPSRSSRVSRMTRSVSRSVQAEQASQSSQSGSETGEPRKLKKKKVWSLNR